MSNIRPEDAHTKAAREYHTIVAFLGILFGLPLLLLLVLLIIPEAEAQTTPINNAPEWLNDLIRYLDGDHITDVEFWHSIERLITTRLNSEYLKQDKYNIIIQGTIAAQTVDEETVDVNLKSVRVVGLNTQKDQVELLVEYDLINTGAVKRTVTESKFTMYGDGRLLAAGSDPDDKTINPWSKQTSFVTVIVDLKGLSSTEMIHWYNQVDVWVIEGSARIGTIDWDQFRSVL